MLAVLLAAVLAALPGAVAVAVDSDAPLAGCPATRLGDDQWRYDCDGFRGDVHDNDAGSLLPDVFLEDTAAGLRRALGDRAQLSRTRGRLAGRNAELLLVSAGTTHGITAVLSLPGGIRVLGCLSASAERCRGVAEALAAGPWRAIAPGAVLVAAPELRLAGRRPVVPEGCRGGASAPGGRIECPGGATVFWGEVGAGGPAEDGMDAIWREITARAPSVSPERVACRIAGADASCERLAVDDRGHALVDGKAAAGRQRIVLLRGTASLGGRRTHAMCLGLGPEPLPRPCGSVFELR